MPHFDTLSSAPGVTGLYEFSQKSLRRGTRTYSDDRGKCKGLVIEWLSRKAASFDAVIKPQEDSGDLSTESSSLIGSALRTYIIGRDTHAMSHSSSSDRDEKTALLLAKAGLTRVLAEKIEKDQSFKDGALDIAQHVSAARSRFFTLSFRGGGAHMIGIVRKGGPGAFVEIRVFDPNEGEFAVQGKIGLLSFLVKLKAITYPHKYDEKYRLVAYK